MIDRDEKNLAFAQVLHELFAQYPPTKNADAARSYRSFMTTYVATDNLKMALALSEAAQVPKEQVEAMIALIYG